MLSDKENKIKEIVDNATKLKDELQMLKID